MLTIGICDSNAAHREQLQRVLKALLFEEGDVTYLQFPTGTAVLQALQVRQQAIDLLFLEVALPDMSGMMLASILRRDGYRLDLIFLTELERKRADFLYAAQLQRLNGRTVPEGTIADLLHRIRQLHGHKIDAVAERTLSNAL